MGLHFHEYQHNSKRMISAKKIFLSLLYILTWFPGFNQNKSDIIIKARESVVWIHAFNMPYSVDQASYKTGTGYVVGNEGMIITNHHVINDINGLVIYSASAETPFYGTVVWSDSILDLAVVKAFDCKLKPIDFEYPENIRQGDETLVLGFPGQGYKNESLKVSWGIISSNPEDSTIQTTAAINSGNSGGPAINLQGKVIGTVFAKMVGLSIEGTGFIRNVKYSKMALKKATDLPEGKPGYFGTSKFEAYKKICDAAILGWKASKTEEIPVRESYNKQAKELILNALDNDPNFCEAYYFLAAYYLIQSRDLCLNDRDKEAKSEFANFKQAFNTAQAKSKELRPSLLFSKSSLQELGNDLKDKEINCSRYREFNKDIYYAYLNKEKRWEELLEYINTGQSPELLKRAIYGNSGNSYSDGVSYSSERNRTEKKSTLLTIGTFTKDAPVRFSFIYTQPFQTYNSNLGFSFGNAGKTNGNYIFFKNQLSFQALQDMGQEGYNYEYQRYMVISYNFGIQARFAKNWRFNPKPYITWGYNPVNYQRKETTGEKVNTWYWYSGAFNFGGDIDMWINGSVGLSLSYEYTLYFDKVFPSLYNTENRLNLEYSSFKIGLIF
jgi:hypothetical protein